MFKKTPSQTHKFTPEMRNRIRALNGVSREVEPISPSEVQTRINRLEALAPDVQEAVEAERKILRNIGWVSLAGTASGVGALIEGVTDGQPIFTAIGLGVGVGSGIASYKSFRAERELSVSSTLTGLKSKLESLPPQSTGGQQ